MTNYQVSQLSLGEKTNFSLTFNKLPIKIEMRNGKTEVNSSNEFFLDKRNDENLILLDKHATKHMFFHNYSSVEFYYLHVVCFLAHGRTACEHGRLQHEMLELCFTSYYDGKQSFLHLIELCG